MTGTVEVFLKRLATHLHATSNAHRIRRDSDSEPEDDLHTIADIGLSEKTTGILAAENVILPSHLTVISAIDVYKFVKQRGDKKCFFRIVDLVQLPTKSAKSSLKISLDPKHNRSVDVDSDQKPSEKAKMCRYS